METQEAGTHVAATAGREAHPDATGEDALNLLEHRVQAAVERIRMLQEEREALRERLQRRDEEVETLQKELAASAGDSEEVARLRRERDRLLQDKATAIRRVEAILARLDKLGLD